MSGLGQGLKVVRFKGSREKFNILNFPKGTLFNRAGPTNPLSQLVGRITCFNNIICSANA